MKHNFLGKEVLRHENMQACVQDASQQKQLKAWKTELLQNAYEALSVELGYQMLVDSDEE
ncbi:MAG: hypothetical protein FRX49_06913 [Trebouxia sp. A1-2]|nr:MAG: hypothetical protein FRX49_06913 [Trebouxia sp. A1-2]